MRRKQMASVIKCGSDARRSAVRDHATINGIDYVEVRTIQNPDGTFPNPLVIIHCFKPVAGLKASNIYFAGGVRIKNVEAAWAYPAENFAAEHGGSALASEGELALIAAIEDEPSNVLVVRPSAPGDFTQYELRIVASKSQPEVPADGFDSVLWKVNFSFKVECPSEFDCRCTTDCGQQSASLPEPAIDYMAKDYASFRKLMLDRLSLLMPDWKERNPADIGVVLVELMAYVGDHLSYYQDAVATEAYLGTARRRVSAARHARLLDYFAQDGCNARAWVCFKYGQTSPALLPKKSTLLTTPDGSGASMEVLAQGDSVEQEVNAGAEVFETMHDLWLYKSKNELEFYTWGEPDCWLAAGATQATLVNSNLDSFSFIWEDVPGADLDRLKKYLEDRFELAWIRGSAAAKSGAGGNTLTFTSGDASSNRRASITLDSTTASLSVSGEPVFQFYVAEVGPDKKRHAVMSLDLQVGDILVFEEVEGLAVAAEGGAGDATAATPDPSHRQAVRITRITAGVDRLRGTKVLEVEWGAEDALAFTLCLSRGGRKASTIWGNTVLADHGYTRTETLSALVAAGGKYHPRLEGRPLTHSAPAPDDRGSSARSAFSYDPRRDVRPDMYLTDPADGTKWEPSRDLLSAGEFSERFVVETESDGTSYVRFRNDLRESWPGEIAAGTFRPFEATYRIGNGTKGNVGAESIRRIFFKSGASCIVGGITEIRNPMPASGGTDPETIESIRRHAPQAFRSQERAVTEDDYQEVLLRHPQVQRAAAKKRWTGSWHTMFVAIDRKGGLEVDDEFEGEIAEFLEKYRLAGYDLEIRGPVFVPAAISLKVCLKDGYYEGEVKEALYRAFSNRANHDGSRGFFHPDNFSFGQPLYLSKVYETAMAVPGVLSVEATEFRRRGKPAGSELADGVMAADALEIIRLDNDPNFAEYGTIEFEICQAGRGRGGGGAK
jgi:hypothetical protein